MYWLGDGFRYLGVQAFRPLLVHLAEQLQIEFASGEIAGGVPSSLVQRPEGGKMFGLLLAQAPSGECCVLRAFSGQLGPYWDVDGFVPPVFQRHRLGVQARGEFKVDELTRLLSESASPRRRDVLMRLRRRISRRTMKRVFESYVFENALRERASLLELFQPAFPPWGAGDCAAPKLLVRALALNLKPLCLGEFWWGPPSKSRHRIQGHFYPPCEARCGPILKFLLRGLSVDVMPSC